MDEVGVRFSGSSAGAVGAARQTAAAIETVKHSATGSSAPLRGMERDLGRVERGALAGSGAFKGLGRSVAFASGAFLGAAGFVAVIRHSIDVVLASQTSIAKLDQAVKNAHASVKAMTPILEEHAAAARKLGFEDNDVRDAEAKLVTAFGATRKALDELSAAQDLARQSNIPLGDATRQLILLQEGNMRAAKQFGLSLPDLTAKQWAAKAAVDGLNVAQEKGKTLYDELLPRIKDQAKAFADSPAGKIAEFHAEITHLQESIGTGLLPVVNKYLTEVDDWLAKGPNQKRVTDDVRKAVDTLAGVLGDVHDVIKKVKPVADDVVKALGGWKRVIEDLIALKIASTVLGWASAFKKLAGMEGIAGAEASAGGLLGKLTALQKLGAIGIVISFVPKAKPSSDPNAASNNPALKFLGGLPLVGGVFSQANRLSDYLNNALGITGGSSKSGGGGGLLGSPFDSLAGANPKVSAGIVATAKGSLGVPYSFGGAPSLSKPTDCSGLMVAVFAKNGISLPRTSQAQYASAPIKNAKPLLPGDLVFSEGVHPGHVGLYVGDGMVLEDPHTGDHVKTVPLSAFGWNGESARWWGGLQSTGGGGASQTSTASAAPYGPDLTKTTHAPPATKTKWVGATAATIIGAQGSVSALLRGLPADLDPVERNAVAHIKAIQDALHIHMTPAELATDRVALTRWGKVLHEEINKNAKIVAAAAAEAKKTFDRALSLDISHVLRDFDQTFQAQLRAFDRETQRGLARFVVSQTPEEKALADYIAQRAAEQHAATVTQQQSDLAAAIATGDPAQIKAAQDAINTQLEDDKQAALQSAADASRAAQDAKTTADQQAYQDERDAQKQALQNINDDQKIALQNNLDDWTAWLESKKKSYTDFLDWLRSQGFDTGALINPGPSGSGSGNAPPGASTIPLPGKVYPFAAGGKVPGQFVGRQDTIMARLTPGEHVTGRQLTAAMEKFFYGGAGGPTVAVFDINGHRFAQAVARPMSDEQARQIGYTIQRG